MKLRLAVLLAVALVLPLSAGAAPAFKATLTTSGHAPKVNAKWRYAVRVASLHDQPIRATITTQLVDPYGGVHPVEFGCCKRNVVNHPFTGVFRDYVIYPPESKGFKLTFRVIIKALGGKRVLSTWVKSR